jgi:hypothetical protein
VSETDGPGRCPYPHGTRLSSSSAAPQVGRTQVNVSLRRIFPIPARSGGGRLTERTPAVQPRRPEPLFMTLRRHRTGPPAAAKARSGLEEISACTWVRTLCPPHNAAGGPVRMRRNCRRFCRNWIVRAPRHSHTLFDGPEHPRTPHSTAVSPGWARVPSGARPAH